VFGGARHLETVSGLARGQVSPWPVPFSDGIDAVVALRGRPVVVLASGDPFFYGVGSTLVRHVPAHEILCMPGVSSIALACARMGWGQQDVRVHSLCGRPIACLSPSLQPGAKLVVLSADGTTPATLATWLTDGGFGGSRLNVLQSLGATDEARISAVAREGIGTVGALNIVAVEVEADIGARLIPLASGLDDALFEHDGQLTKREVRAVTLSSLAPRAGECLWDIGAGAGSVAIEWMLSDPTNRAVAIERDAERASRIARNALALGVPSLRVVLGAAPAELPQDGAPDAIFIGGGVSVPGMIDAAWAALRAGGRLVANAVTHEGEMALGLAQGRLGGDLLRLSVERLAPVGGMQAFRPAMTVTQWVVRKPVSAR